MSEPRTTGKHRKPRATNAGEGTKKGRRGKRGVYDYGKPIKFVIHVKGGIKITLGVDTAMVAQGVLSDFILAHSPMVLRDGTTLPKMVTARFEMPPRFLEQNIPASTGH
jgi:hypothetical protein